MVFSRRHKGRGSATCSRAQPRSIDVSSPRPELYVEYGTAKENSMHSIRWYVTLRMLCSHHTPMHVLASTNGVHAYSIPHYFRSNNRSTTGQSLTHSTSKTQGQQRCENSCCGFQEGYCTPRRGENTAELHSGVKIVGAG